MTDRIVDPTRQGIDLSDSPAPERGAEDWAVVFPDRTGIRSLSIPEALKLYRESGPGCDLYIGTTCVAWSRDRSTPYRRWRISPSPKVRA